MLPFLLAQAVPVPIPVVIDPSLSAATIAAITAAAVTVIGTLTGGIVSIIVALRDTRAKVAETKVAVEHNAELGRKAGAARDQKLERIEVLVDGRYSEVLQELADMKLLLAKSTGLRADHDQATSAQQRADSQHARVAAFPPSLPASAEPIKVEIVNAPDAPVPVVDTKKET